MESLNCSEKVLLFHALFELVQKVGRFGLGLVGVAASALPRSTVDRASNLTDVVTREGEHFHLAMTSASVNITLNL